MLDAYTIRKAIPRILLAVIAINLSIYLCVAAIDISVVVGHGLNQLLVGSFVDDNSFKSVGIEANATNNIAGVLATGTTMGALFIGIYGSITAVGASVISVLGLLLPLIITVALIVLAVLFTLIIRQALLIFLTVISPLAFVCYILPGTEKYFKQWGDQFLRTLMVYPIIAAIFAMSNVMASLLLESATQQGSASMIKGNYIFAQSDAVGILQIISAILVLYLPLILIPFAFKLAGGAMGAIMNAANQQANKLSSQAGEAIKKSRADDTSWLGKNRLRAQRTRSRRGTTAGQLASGSRAFVRGGYRGMRNGEGFKGSLKNAAGSYKSKARSLHEPGMYAAANELMENNANFKAISGNDDLLWAAMRSRDRTGIQQELMRRKPHIYKEGSANLENATDAIMEAQSGTGNQEFLTAATLAQAKTGTGFNYGDDSPDGFKRDGMFAAIRAASGDDGNMAGKMLADMQKSSREAGRNDLGASSYGQLSEAYFAYDGTGQSEDAAMDRVHRDVIDSNSSAILQGKKKSVQNLTNAARNRIDVARSKQGVVGAQEYMKELALFQSKNEGSRSAPANNATVWAESVAGKSLDLRTLSREQQQELGITGKTSDAQMRDGIAPGSDRAIEDQIASLGKNGRMTNEELAARAAQHSTTYNQYRYEFGSRQSTMSAADQANAASIMGAEAESEGQ